MKRPRMVGGDAELHAFVDGQLDLAGRLDVQERLTGEPDLAAQIAADMRLNDELRLIAATLAPDTPSERTRAAAERLSTALSADRRRVPLRRLAAAVALFALGWGASLGWLELRGETLATPAPATIERDYSPTLLTAAAPDRMLDFPPQTVGRVLGVAMPTIPEGWQVVNSDIVQHAGQAAANLIFQTAEYGRVALKVWRSGDVGIVLPGLSEATEIASSHWQLVGDNYRLTSEDGRPISSAALKLFQTLY
jgi:hypothetical protein